MRSSVARRGEEGEPRWVEEERRPGPGALFEQTYSAIAGEYPFDRRRRVRLVRAMLWIVPVVAVAIAVLARRTMPELPLPGVSSPPTPAPLPTATAPARRPGPLLVGAVPVRPKATVRVGEMLDFAVVVGGGEPRYGWTIDGVAAGTGPRWTYAPAPGTAARHRIEVSVADRSGRSTQRWEVRVLPGRAPRILATQPPGDLVAATRDQTVELAVSAETATADETLQTAWTVDGAHAGQGRTFSWRPSRTGVFDLRAVVQGSFGGATSREWSVHVADPEPAPVAAATPPPVAVPALPAAPAVAETPRVQQSRRTAAAAARPAADEDVRHWLERYAAAWRAHDVDALRRMGQVSDDDQVAALRRYFASVPDLDVELDLVAMDVRPDGAVVRFVRRDRFRDPAGRLVEKESPPIEKRLVRTPGGLRLAPLPPA